MKTRLLQLFITILVLGFLPKLATAQPDLPDDPDQDGAYPDLIVSEILVTPENPVEGETFSVSITIANQDTDTAGTFLTIVELDGSTVGSTNTEELLPGESVTGTFAVSGLAAGDYTLSVTVDPNNDITESNEENNNSTKNVVVEPPDKPDLVVGAITLTPTNPTTEDNIIANITLENQGTAAVGSSFTWQVVYDGTPLATKTSSDLAPGENRQETYEFQVNEAGTFPITVEADPSDAIDESDESNNSLTVDLVIDPHPILSVNPLSQDVGSTAGTTGFEVTNSGSGTLEWSTSTDESWMAITGGSSGSGPGTITVSYDENSSTSNRTGTITVSSSNASNGPVEVSVTQGAPGEPVISLSKTEINFGELLVGEAEDVSFIIENTGEQALTGSVELADAASFSIAEGGGSYTLETGQTRQVTVGFAPATSGEKTGSVEISHNADNKANPVTISLTGYANESPTVSIDNGPTDGSTIDFNDPEFVWSGSDANGTVEGYEVELQGPSSTAFSTSETTYRFTGLENGNYNFQVRAIDNDGAASPWVVRSFTVNVITPVLGVDPSNRTVASSAGTTTFDISNDGSGTLEWSASTQESWLSIEGAASGTGSGSIQVAYTENTSNERTGTVTVTSNNADNSPVSVTITQNAPIGDPPVTAIYSQGWNLVSIPEEISRQSPEDYFATIIDNTDIYEFDGQYIEMQSLVSGKGYWLKLDAEEEVEFNGQILKSLTLNLESGWNLVGTIGEPLSVTGDIQDPNGIIENGAVWALDYDDTSGTYELLETTDMLPGKGYFIKTTSAGDIVLSNQ